MASQVLTGPYRALQGVTGPYRALRFEYMVLTSHFTYSKSSTLPIKHSPTLIPRAADFAGLTRFPLSSFHLHSHTFDPCSIMLKEVS
jgi:hypothetical protein